MTERPWDTSGLQPLNKPKGSAPGRNVFLLITVHKINSWPRTETPPIGSWKRVGEGKCLSLSGLETPAGARLPQGSAQVGRSSACIFDFVGSKAAEHRR